MGPPRSLFQVCRQLGGSQEPLGGVVCGLRGAINHRTSTSLIRLNPPSERLCSVGRVQASLTFLPTGPPLLWEEARLSQSWRRPKAWDFCVEMNHNIENQVKPGRPLGLSGPPAAWIFLGTPNVFLFLEFLRQGPAIALNSQRSCFSYLKQDYQNI